MRRWGAWGAGMVLLLGMGRVMAGPPQDAGGSPSDQPAAQGAGGLWFPKWLGGTGGPAPANKDPETELHQGVEKRDVQEDPRNAQPPNPLVAAAARRAREEARYTRRAEVCFRLGEIAERTNNEALRRKAKELEDRAWAVYMARTRSLPAGQEVFQSDRQTLEKHLGAPAAVTPARRRESALYQVPSQDGHVAQEGP